MKMHYPVSVRVWRDWVKLFKGVILVGMWGVGGGRGDS